MDEELNDDQGFGHWNEDAELVDYYIQDSEPLAPKYHILRLILAGVGNAFAIGTAVCQDGIALVMQQGLRNVEHRSQIAHQTEPDSRHDTVAGLFGETRD